MAVRIVCKSIVHTVMEVECKSQLAVVEVFKRFLPAAVEINVQEFLAHGSLANGTVLDTKDAFCEPSYTDEAETMIVVLESNWSFLMIDTKLSPPLALCSTLHLSPQSSHLLPHSPHSPTPTHPSLLEHA